MINFKYTKRNNSPRSVWQKLWYDRNGKLDIAHWPNLPLIGWLAFKLMARSFPDSRMIDLYAFSSEALLFTWAYLEIRYSDSWFRKALGIVVLCFILSSKIKPAVAPFA